ncbi:uncharacterized protein LOC129910836 [Episyrphus balteatus]|uniref:uncharacterized protein LOC129910836 n=1 Tax=Episyrphus balteatus TaxID=286459 RepID=UPI002485233F|nr:uncharacterized protein LOC129910836 [Episyrphus balteatus]
MRSVLMQVEDTMHRKVEHCQELLVCPHFETVPGNCTNSWECLVWRAGGDLHAKHKSGVDEVEVFPKKPSYTTVLWENRNHNNFVHFRRKKHFDLRRTRKRDPNQIDSIVVFLYTFTIQE